MRACRDAFDLASSLSWASRDPFDLLLMPLGESVRRVSHLGARALVQLGRRSGPRLSRYVHVARHEEAKATADFLAAAAVLAESPSLEAQWAKELVPELVERLERLAIPTQHGHGWGLGFPYASRFVSVPANTPNAYTTVAAIDALADAATLMGDNGPLALARSGASFIANDLGTVAGASCSWYRYWPGDDTCIVNLQALTAAAFRRLAVSAGGDEGLSAGAEDAAAAAAAAQWADGSFPYALDSRGRFVDSFHTGFVLEGLSRFARLGGTIPSGSVDRAVERGMSFFRVRLLDEHGLPLASPGGARVDDGQNLAQLIQTLLECGSATDRPHARAIWRYWSARVGGVTLRGDAASDVSLRWELAPMVLALAKLGAALVDDRPEQA